MARPVIISTNAGELSPLMDARVDVAKYRSGARTMKGMIPRKYGPGMRSPGTKYIASQKYSDKKARMIPFEYSTEVSYAICFEDQVNRYFVDGGQLVSGGSPVETITPYLEADLFAIQYVQSNDVMWLTHNSYAPRQLSRTSATAFSLSEITFTKGPFLQRNDIYYEDGVTMTPSVTTGTGTLTLSATTNFEFESTHVGALFKLTQPRVNTDTTGSLTSPTTGVIGSALYVDGVATFTLHGTWTGTVKLQRNADGTNWETVKSFVSANDSRFSHVFNELEDNVQYRINVTSLTSGTVVANLTLDNSEQDGVCRVTAVNSTTEAAITVLSDFASTDATTRWAEGAWSGKRGYPKTFCFFEDRACYAGTTYEPQTIWLSAVGEYQNFKEGTNPSDSFKIELNARDRNAIQWISSLESLVVGTTGGEWRVRASSFDETITPLNYNARQQSSYGSKDLQAFNVNDTVLFVDRASRKIRELVYIDQRQKYDAPDITVFCEHLTDGGIIDFTVQRYPEPILWITTDQAPYLVGLSNNKEQDILAGFRDPASNDGVIESAAAIYGGEEDEIWMTVKRTINGSTVRYVEQKQPWDYGDLEDAWFVDCGLEYNGAATSTLTGLSHLEGETVVIHGDGIQRVSKVVTGNIITLEDGDVEHAIIGLPREYEYKSMRLDPDNLDETTRSSFKKISQLFINVYNSHGASYGDGTTTYDLPWPRTGLSDPSLYTGDMEVVFDAGFSREDNIVISGESTYPFTLVSLVALIDQVGR